jgi:hypothetical protein
VSPLTTGVNAGCGASSIRRSGNNCKIHFSCLTIVNIEFDISKEAEYLWTIEKDMHFLLELGD